MELNINDPLQRLTGKVYEWFEAFVDLIPNMVVSILLLVLFIIIGRLTKKVTAKLLSKTSSNRALNNLFTQITYYSVMGLGLFIILGILKLDKAVTSLLAGIGVVGIALGFAFQDIAANFISGIILAFRRPVSVGDIIEVAGIMGTVDRTNLRVTVVRTFQGQEVYITNKTVLQSEITNYSVLGQRRIDIPVGISYGDDLNKVERVVINAISNIKGIVRKDDIIFDYDAFGDSSINFYIRFWIEYPDQPGYLRMKNVAIKAIKQAFDENDITIPFPIRTLDFGIKGGQRLNELDFSNQLTITKKNNNN